MDLENPVYEDIEGVRLYSGQPGPEAGHAVAEQSYFDRFWEGGGQTDRCYIVVEKKDKKHEKASDAKPEAAQKKRKKNSKKGADAEEESKPKKKKRR